jgi:hypothetical protein
MEKLDEKSDQQYPQGNNSTKEKDYKTPKISNSYSFNLLKSIQNPV